MLSDKLINDILTASLSYGGEFSEVFVEEKISNSVALINGVAERVNGGKDFGVGLRIFTGTSSLYAFTNIITVDDLIKMARELSLCAKENGTIKVLDFTKREIINVHKIIELPTVYSKKNVLDYLRLAHNSSKKTSDLITETSMSYSDVKQNILVANSNGLYISDERVRSRFFLNSVATRDNNKETGYVSYGAQKGFEHIKDFDFRLEGEKSAKMAMDNLNAGLCPSGKMPVIIDNGFGGVIFHEACGHSLEATAIAKGASVFCGKKGEKIANEKVTAIDDGTITNAWGSINIDDEGNKSKKNILIKNGVLNSYLVDVLNGKKMNEISTGSGRRESYKFAPTSRMTNTYIDNGNDSLDNIFASVDYGLYAKTMGGGSVVPTTGDFNFSVKEAFIIKNGKIQNQVKGATLIGKGSEVLQNIDMVSNNLKHSAGVCGSISGQIPTNVGQPTIRVKEITVGGLA